MNIVTLHFELKNVDDNAVELRAHYGNPNQAQTRTLARNAVAPLIADSMRYYGQTAPTHALLQSVGKKLHDWLDGDERFIASAIENARNRAEVLTLAITTNGDLSVLPWEAMHDGTLFLIQRENPRVVPIRRVAGNADPFEPANHALRVLFMAATPTSGGPMLNFEAEEAAILRATETQRTGQQIFLSVEESGSLDGLREVVDSYPDNTFDVVHLTGHAAATTDGPVFAVENEDGSQRLAKPSDLARAVPYKPKLLFVSGCETGRDLPSLSTDSFAEQMVAAGFRAVFGWSRKVLDHEATAACAALYKSLSMGQPLPFALSETFRKMFEDRLRDWHQLRLFVAGDVSGALVTAPRSPGRKSAPPKSVAEKFKDSVTGKQRISSREGFVGRRRALQRCLRTLRAGEKRGVVLHGMGGNGKSTLAGRLCDRLEQDGFKTTLIFGALDELRLVSVIANRMQNPDHIHELEEPAVSLKLRLKVALSEERMPDRLLFVFDDFEFNCEDKANPLQNGTLQLTDETKRMLDALTGALDALTDDEQPRHKIIITCRYALREDGGGPFLHEPVDALRGADWNKKVQNVLVASKATKEENNKTLIIRAVNAADGSPRLLEWLFEVIEAGGVNLAAIIDAMEKTETRFRENILAEKLLASQSADLRGILARGEVYELPVPKAALAPLCADLSNFDAEVDRATALGLLETTLDGEERLYRVPRLLDSLLTAEKPADPVKHAEGATKTLHKLWWENVGKTKEQHVLEIYRLSLVGKVKEIASNMAVFLFNLRQNRSQFYGAKQVCQSLLELLPNDPRFLLNLSKMEHVLGDVTRAKELQERVLGINESIGNLEGKSATLHALANLDLQEGRIEQAQSRYIEALAIDENLGDLQGKGASLHQLAMLNAQQGRIEQARLQHEEALMIFELIEDIQSKSVTLHQLGLLDAQQGQLEQARTRYEQSLAISESIENLQGKSSTLHQLAKLEAQQGRFEQARLLHKESLAIFRLIGDLQGQGAALHALGMLDEHQGQIEKARANYKESLAINSSIDHYYGVAFCLFSLGQMDAQNGDIGSALAALQQAEEIFTRLGAPEAEQVREIAGQVQSSAILQRLGEEKTAQLMKLLESGNQEAINAFLAEHLELDA